MIKFLNGDSIWNTLSSESKQAKKRRIAVAYVSSSNEISELRFDAGDELIVDASLRTIASGSTNPFVLADLVDRGVKVYSHNRLHAKFFIFDGKLITGSANVSGNSRKNLREASVITDDSDALREASKYFETLLQEAECLTPELLNIYKLAFATNVPDARHLISENSLLWIINGVYDLSSKEEAKHKTVTDPLYKTYSESLSSNFGVGYYIVPQKWQNNLKDCKQNDHVVLVWKKHKMAYEPQRVIAVKHAVINGNPEMYIFFEARDRYTHEKEFINYVGQSKLQTRQASKKLKAKIFAAGNELWQQSDADLES